MCLCTRITDTCPTGQSNMYKIQALILRFTSDTFITQWMQNTFQC